jgi:hypothetical protein
MHVTEVADMKDSARVRTRAPVLWPWVLVVAAWALAGLAVFTNHTYLINHYYLLEESHLPVLVALVVFLACWLVMTAGMMLPSSMPMVYMIVYAGRQQRRPLAVLGAFLALHALVGHRRDHLRARRGVSVHPTQKSLSQAMPQPVRLLRALLSPGGRSRLAPGSAPRRVLPGLLLGAHASHVWHWRGQPAVDGAVDRGDGRREDLSWREAAQPMDRHRPAGACGPLAGASCLAAKLGNIRSQYCRMTT